MFQYNSYDYSNPSHYNPFDNYYNVNYNSFNSNSYYPVTYYPSQYQQPQLNYCFNYLPTTNEATNTIATKTTNDEISVVFDASTSLNSNNSSVQDSSITISEPKPKRIAKKIPFKCQICSVDSSGFHYGAYTCKACKLFFIRCIKKQNEPKKYECRHKNCVITAETRMNCTDCRFKKCLDIGMSKSRSCFGPHKITFSNEIRPKVNQISTLLKFLDNTKEKIQKRIEKTNFCFNELKQLIYHFYSQSIRLILNKETTTTNYDDKSAFVLFCVLFDIQIPQMLHQCNRLENDLKQMISYLQMNILKKIPFTRSLKILTFVLISNTLFRDEISAKQVEYLIDLIKIELMFATNDLNEPFNESTKTYFIYWTNQIHTYFD